jgi:transcription initiation factor TFIIIB Brf1 subunit/transcription initiation factor TFIIB
MGDIFYDSGHSECSSCGKSNNVFDFISGKKQTEDFSKNINIFQNDNFISRCKYCKGNQILTDECSGDILCMDCGAIQESRVIKDEAEWSNYETDRGSGVDNSRVGWRDDSNPYNTLGSTIRKHSYIKVMKDGKPVLRDLYKIHIIASACNKEAAFNLVIKIFDKLTFDNQFNEQIIDHSKRFWNEIVKTGRIFRGGVRSGILASCVYYSCKYLKNDTSKETICQAMVISTDQFVKGEPIFLDILRQSKLANMIQMAEKFSSSINRFNAIVENGLDLDFKVSRECNNIFDLCEEELSEISANAALAGVIGFYIQSNGIKISKKKIAEVTHITNPTLVNAIKIVKTELEHLLSKNDERLSDKIKLLIKNSNTK